MVLSYTTWLPSGPAVEQPRQGASAARVQPLGNPGERQRRLGLRLTRQSHLARITLPPTRQNPPMESCNPVFVALVLGSAVVCSIAWSPDELPGRDKAAPAGQL
jgi:hypothetical protein